MPDWDRKLEEARKQRLVAGRLCAERKGHLRQTHYRELAGGRVFRVCRHQAVGQYESVVSQGNRGGGERECAVGRMPNAFRAKPKLHSERNVEFRELPKKTGTRHPSADRY
jgi:hypothetical protein